jgi:ankyrin repeat protein
MADATSFFFEIAMGRASKVRLLLESSPDLVQMRNQPGDNTALHLAAIWNQRQIAQILLEHHSDVNARKQYGETPLHLAAKWNLVSMMELLLQQRAEVDAREDTNKTSLHFTVQDGRPARIAKCVDLLLVHGADPNAVDKYGNRPLHLLEGLPKSALSLIRAGADIHARNDIGKTALHRAAQWADQLIPTLLRHGAEVNARDNDGQTALHLVVSGWDAKGVKPLLKAGADPHAVDTEGRTPLHMAAFYLCSEGAQALLAARADPNATDAEGLTALSIAKSGPCWLEPEFEEKPTKLMKELRHKFIAVLNENDARRSMTA